MEHRKKLTKQQRDELDAISAEIELARVGRRRKPKKRKPNTSLILERLKELHQ